MVVVGEPLLVALLVGIACLALPYLVGWGVYLELPSKFGDISRPFDFVCDFHQFGVSLALAC